MYQQLTIVGNLGGNPELRYTPTGDAVVNFSVATNRRWTGTDGQPASQTTWFRVTVWGKSAEACNQYLVKGRQVLVVGTLQPEKDTGGPRVWTDTNGNARSSYEVRAGTVQFLGARDDQAPPQGSASQSNQDPVSPTTPTIDPDEIPF